MPQVQVLQRQPGFAEQLGANLGSGLSQGISGALSQMMEQKKQKQTVQDVMSILGIPIPEKSTAKMLKSGSKDLSAEASVPTAKLQLTPENVLAASLAFPQFASPLATMYQAQESRFDKQRAAESERSNKFLDKISGLSEGIPERRLSINSGKQAVTSGQMHPLGGDFWAGVLHLPALQTASGAQLSTAAKTNLIGSLSKATGSRPNQFIEQQITDAFAKPGKRNEANLAQLLMAEAVLDTDEKYSEIAQSLANKYKAETGIIPEGVDREAQALAKQYAKMRQDKLAYDLQENIEKDIGPEKISKLRHVAPGTPLTYEMKEILLEKSGGDLEKAEKLAKGLGYTIPPLEFWQR